MVLASSVVLVIAATLLLTLFVREKDLPPPEPVSPVRHLEERKAAIYENLRDLQFEYRVGKLSDADYKQTKVGLQRELAGVLSEIEKMAPAIAAAAAAPKSKPDVKAETKAETGTVCPHCGAKFMKRMKFCGECGKEIAG